MPNYKDLVYPILVIMSILLITGSLISDTISISKSEANLARLNLVDQTSVRGCVQGVVIVYEDRSEEFVFPYAQPVIISEEAVRLSGSKYKTLVITPLQKRCD